MWQGLRAAFLDRVRRLIGTTQLLNHQQDNDRRAVRRDRQRQLLLTIGNMHRYASATPSALEASTHYRRCAALVSALTPMDVDGGTLIRVGRPRDGGYVMLEETLRAGAVDAAYGFGIGADWSWDDAVAARGIPVLMFDPTIEPPTQIHANSRAFQVGLGGRAGSPQTRPLAEILEAHGHATSLRLILKIDVEGDEWDALDECPAAVLGQFSQIIVEYHGLADAVYDPRTFDRAIRVLQKLHRSHQAVHVHAKGTGNLPVWVGPLVVPDQLETTYVRRADFDGRFRRTTRTFPTDLDEPPGSGWPDLYLGSFSVDPP